MRAIDVHGFAGGFTLGMVEAGFELVGKRENKAGFGIPNCEANRHLLGNNWKSEAVDPKQWTPVDAEVVFGNPPCSGFSVMSNKHFRGVDSKVNQCMWDFVNYAAKVKPVTAVFESVALAYSQGRDLMQRLRASLEEHTGLQYTITHVLHNALSVGGPSMRKRYFWVVSQVPFGIERPIITKLPILNEVIGDLSRLNLQWSSQLNLEIPQGDYAASLIRMETDGHQIHDNPHTQRIKWLLSHGTWGQGEYAQQVLRRFYKDNQEVPEPWKHQSDKLLATDFFQGFTSPTRWKGDEPARVITGAGLLNTIHPYLDRTLTHREVARIMGFNDAWKIAPLKNVPGLFMTWGKGITVDCGRWIGEWIGAALRGTPGSVPGELIGDREFLINVTNDWQSVYGRVVTYGKPVKEKKVTEVAEGTVVEGTETETKSKGRPRAAATLARDEVVFAILQEGPITREALATRLTEIDRAENPEAAEVKPGIAYLSLWRLRRDGRVARKHVDGKHQWSPDFVGEAADVASEELTQAEEPALV
jgi:site-specific DNA-cytosine methylase